MGLVSTNLMEQRGLLQKLFECGMEKLVDDALYLLGGKDRVFLDGDWVGMCKDSSLFVSKLRRKRRRMEVPHQVDLDSFDFIWWHFGDRCRIVNSSNKSELTFFASDSPICLLFNFIFSSFNSLLKKHEWQFYIFIVLDFHMSLPKLCLLLMIDFHQIKTCLEIISSIMSWLCSM